jgi:hypothetical protein
LVYSTEHIRVKVYLAAPLEGWPQERLGSRAGTHREEELNKSILTGRKREKTETIT